jgi:hypothetical protein
MASKTATIFLREDALSYVFSSKAAPVTIPGTNGTPTQILDTSHVRAYRMDMELIGANTGINIYGDKQNSQYYNYYLAHCSNGVTNVPTFEKVVYENIYNGIDMVCYRVNDDFKYDFIVHPGADPNQIQMHFVGGEVFIKDDGSLLVQSNYGSILQDAPTTYQENPDGTRHEIANK